MAYYELRKSLDVHHGVTRDPDVGEPSIFIAGGEIGGSADGVITFPVDNTFEHLPADYLGIVVPAMSDLLVQTLRESGVDNLQTFEARLENSQTGEGWGGYNAVNIVGKVACAHLSSSQSTELAPDLYEFQRLVIDEERAAGALLFRLAEAPQTILIDARLGDHLRGDDPPELTGLEFRYIESA